MLLDDAAETEAEAEGGKDGNDDIGEPARIEDDTGR
jgi:hypothetical protein